ncbi:hypothetical protein PL9631_780052 [Planktothrix paucivesiculata PCC 9631]|uniref:Uncharacterized protein n=1 Tax=Planktothrix paucivesiculata PCC 9631 TaxID=671071 RepID=A0A7Z9E3W0_9CYAN|nr:hypothetical protein PL9631_780052 [Planktothrix paucivesiculata PCC 9631]
MATPHGWSFFNRDMKQPKILSLLPIPYYEKILSINLIRITIYCFP